MFSKFNKQSKLVRFLVIANVVTWVLAGSLALSACADDEPQRAHVSVVRSDNQ